MSETTPNVNPAVNEAAAPSTTSTAPIDIGSITGAQAVELAAKSKETGKSVEELLKTYKTEAKKSEPVVAQEEADETPDNKEVKPKVVKPTKFKVKVDGQELEVDEKELLRGYSHQKAANKILQEGKAAHKQATEFIEMMKDPQQALKVLNKLGHDPRALAEKYLIEQLEDEMMDPRDKALREAQNRLKSIDESERLQKQAIQKAHHDEMVKKHMENYEQSFIQTLQKAEVPANKYTVGEMAKYIGRAAKIGFEMTTDEAAQLVKQDIKQAQLSLIGNADGETLLKLFGDDVANKMLQARGKKPINFENNSSQSKGTINVKDKSKSTKPMTTVEWKRFQRK